VRFALEPRASFRVGGGARQQFDRNQAVQSRVAGAVDLAHAARAQRSEDFVRTESSAGSKRHDVARDEHVARRERCIERADVAQTLCRRADEEAIVDVLGEQLLDIRSTLGVVATRRLEKRGAVGSPSSRAALNSSVTRSHRSVMIAGTAGATHGPRPSLDRPCGT
jgi:hypothetical protein